MNFFVTRRNYQLRTNKQQHIIKMCKVFGENMLMGLKLNIPENVWKKNCGIISLIVTNIFVHWFNKLQVDHNRNPSHNCSCVETLSTTRASWFSHSFLRHSSFQKSRKLPHDPGCTLAGSQNVISQTVSQN